MSKLTEYLKLIPKGIKNIPQIIEGLSNQIKMEIGTIPKEDEDEIIRRRLICSQCPFLSVNALEAKLYTTDRTDAHCTHCGCPIATRTASLEANCGIEDYNLNNPKTPIPLKWEKVK